MSETTKIQWADGTFNPWIGCTKVSPGCLNCYAENTTRARVLRKRGHETWGKGAQRSRTSAATWKQPLKWNSEVAVHPDYRSRIFPSLCDWLDDEVPIEWLADFLKLIYDTPHLDWLLLTKRPENFRLRIGAVIFELSKSHKDADVPFGKWLFNWLGDGAPKNVWFGFSAENEDLLWRRWGHAKLIPSVVTFISLEPLLAEVSRTLETVIIEAKTLGKTLWPIAGGESGSKARHCYVDWLRNIVGTCRLHDVRCFVKQLGAEPVEMKQLPRRHTNFAYSNPPTPVVLDLMDKKGGDMAEWPEDLRVREFPTV